MADNKIKQLYRFLSPRFQSVFLDYKVNTTPRYGHGKASHPMLKSIIENEHHQYEILIDSFLNNKSAIQNFKKQNEESDENLPTWNNNFLPGLDIIALYSMIGHFKPKKYIEIGSGNSTKVVRKAIQDFGTNTKVTSIDPYPRAQIDHLADVVIRQPFEDVKDIQFIIDELDENDILFIDNSHRSFTNSDATIFFLEILPYLKKGVIVQVHDIYIPDDYPDFMAERFYNEQYVLAAFVLANPTKFRPIFPCWYVSQTPILSAKLAPIFEHKNLEGVEKHGGSFWLKIDA